MRNDESLQLGNRREAAFSQMTCMIQELKKQKEKKRKDDQTVRVATRTEAGKRRSEFVLPRWKAPRTCPQSYVHDKLMLHMQTDTLTCHSLPLNLENKVPLKNRKRQRRPWSWSSHPFDILSPISAFEVIKSKMRHSLPRWSLLKVYKKKVLPSLCTRNKLQLGLTTNCNEGKDKGGREMKPKRKSVIPRKGTKAKSRDATYDGDAPFPSNPSMNGGWWCTVQLSNSAGRSFKTKTRSPSPSTRMNTHASPRCFAQLQNKHAHAEGRIKQRIKK